MRTIHQLSIGDVRMLLLTGKIAKARKVLSFFCLQVRRNFRHFFKLGVLGRLACSQNSRMLITFFRSDSPPPSYPASSFPLTSGRKRTTLERPSERPDLKFEYSGLPVELRMPNMHCASFRLPGTSFREGLSP